MNNEYCEITLLPCPYLHDTCADCDLNAEYDRAVALGREKEDAQV